VTADSVSAVLTLIFATLAIGGRFVAALRPHTFTFSVLATGALAVSRPDWLTEWWGLEMRYSVAPLVQVVLFGMGLTLTPADFGRVLRMPRAIGIGLLLQFSILPAASLAFVWLFGLTGATAAGLILISSMPGGTASNVMVYLARANVPLSVTMTACSTLLSPVITPALMLLLAGTHVPVEPTAMMRSILAMVVAPLVLGILVNRFLPTFARRLSIVLPVVAIAAICLIIGITIALSRDEFLRIGLSLLGAAACLNLTGLALGYLAARLFGLDLVDSRTVAIEVGMQNGGMATGLAFNVLREPLAALGAAAFGPFSAISTSCLASLWKRRTGAGVVEPPVKPGTPS
jgi:bile acid:Na+ symporter, BASS family